jgi:tRNA-splicing ligase RtcB (3'-phosphate/5'-hydroxy nucleic acid ligase)
MQIYGTHDRRTVDQLKRCVDAETGAKGVLCADGHVGYSMPIGGVVAYRRHVSPSGVGYDIACGNLAVRTPIPAADVTMTDRRRIAGDIQRQVSFGVGRSNADRIDDPVFDAIASSPVAEQRRQLPLARSQLGTVGSGNHYVDLLEDESGRVWVAAHFGSRGFGHRTATGFMNVARGRAFDASGGGENMDAPPLLLDASKPGGQDYIAAMTIAGQYAYAGREAVVRKVLEILGAEADFTVHNHHNFAWLERHGGATYWVVRKGATPAFPGQWGFVGGSMGDISVVLRGVESRASADALYSTVHGAGRVMSRTQAAGKRRWRKDARGETRTGGLVDFEAVKRDLDSRGIILRGAGADEAPQVYRPLRSVLDAHRDTIEIVHTLKPLIVVMAGADEYDPYRD